MNEAEFEELLGRAVLGHTEAVLSAVDAEPGLATRAGMDGWMLLLRVCFEGHVDLARGLLDRHADMHARKADGWNALICASVEGHVAVATLLLDRGANVNATDKVGHNALWFAALFDNPDLCLLLISRAAELTENALKLYGMMWYDSQDPARPSLSAAVKAERRETLRAAFAEGPHESQVRRRNWERRRDFVTVLVCHDFQPLAERRAELDAQHPPLPPDVEIPPLAGPRLALLRDKILSHPGLWRIVASYI